MRNNPDRSLVAEVANSDSDSTEYASKTNQKYYNINISEK